MPDSDFSKFIDYVGQHQIMGETSKAHKRRLAEGWFQLYADPDKSGIDIGCGTDPLNHTFRRWDVMYGDGDAVYMDGVPENTFHTVYASHVLEHLREPETALRRWYEILKPGGHLIVMVPHRDMYEKKRFLPSIWNPDHKWFWLPDQADILGTKSFRATIDDAIPHGELISFKILDELYVPLSAHEHAVGEYSLEAIIRKPT